MIPCTASYIKFPFLRAQSCRRCLHFNMVYVIGRVFETKDKGMIPCTASHIRFPFVENPELSKVPSL